MEAWDDIRFFLALVRYGSVRTAAAALRVNHTTVSRRLRGLEERLGSRLVRRTREGYALTSDGEVIFASGEAVERQLELAVRRVEGADEAVSGTVRITLTDLLFELATPALEKITKAHPGLQLEISVETQLRDLSASDAEVALRLSDAPPDDLIGRNLARMPVAIYGARDLIPDPASVDLEHFPWIRWQQPWQQARLETWPDEQFPGARVAARVDSYRALEQLVALGAGIGLLTPWSADRRGDLVRLSEPMDELGMDLWLLTHADLRGVRRIRTVTDALAGELRKMFETPPVPKASGTPGVLV